MLGHKTSPKKFKKTEILSSILSYHNGMKRKINYKEKTGKTTKTWGNETTCLFVTSGSSEK